MTSKKDGYVMRRGWTFEWVKIPDGHVECPHCNGSGEIRCYYGSPGDRSQFEDCWLCSGRGYVNEEMAEWYRKRSYFAKRRTAQR